MDLICPMTECGNEIVEVYYGNLNTYLYILSFYNLYLYF
jgi:hypothetical protein